LPFWAAAICLGCGSRVLDPNDMNSDLAGRGGATGARDGGTGGAPGDGGISISIDARVDYPLAPIDGPIGVSYCGNGKLDPGEQCDDGNKMPGDGCTSLCQVEACWACGSCGTGQPCVPTPICGDGVLTPPERCDDDNATGGDGCSADCSRIEAGWQCSSPGYRCFPICGDRLVVGSESCDDGNTIAGDGCSDICLVEPTTARCGDGMIEGAEPCDDGAGNTDGVYGGCTTHCQIASCGDGVVNGPEQCDEGPRGNTTTYGNMSGCTPGCTFPHFCGDGIVDENEGEQCDFGLSNGDPAGYCTKDCKILI
jgi:cysteine-rich repeat protein